MMHDYITTLMTRYAGRVKTWDVVNEAFNQDGSYHQNIWYEVIGPDYIEQAFRFARDADPSAKLFYNDNGAEAGGSKQRAILTMSRDFRARQVPLDGIGFQKRVVHLSAVNASLWQGFTLDVARAGRVVRRPGWRGERACPAVAATGRGGRCRTRPRASGTCAARPVPPARATPARATRPPTVHQPPRRCPSAQRTAEPIGPAQPVQVIQAGSVTGKPCPQRRVRAGVVDPCRWRPARHAATLLHRDGQPVSRITRRSTLTQLDPS